MEQEVMAGQFHAPSHPGVLKNLNVNGIYFRDILLTRISRGANNCGQHPFEKNSYFIMRFSPHFQLYYFNDRLEFCKFFEGKIKRINNSDLFSQPPLLIFIKGANISGGHCSHVQQNSERAMNIWPRPSVVHFWTLGFHICAIFVNPCISHYSLLPM